MDAPTGTDDAARTPMNVLITGAGGFLGGYLAETFLEAGHRVRGLVRRTSHTDVVEKLGVETVAGDLKGADSLRRAVAGMDVVVHAASTMAGMRQEYEEATVKGTRTLLAAAEDAGVRRFIYISSIAVYSIHRLPAGRQVTEDSPYESDPAFLSSYISSRIAAEQAVLEHASRGRMQVAVLRLGILYGPRCKWNLSRLGYAVGSNWYVIIGNGRTLLPVCHVRNCARAILAAAETPELAATAFTIVDDERFSQAEYLRRLKKDVRPRLKIVRCPYLLARTVGWLGETAGRLLHLPWPLRKAQLITCKRQVNYSNERAKSLLGWRPQVGKEEGLAETMSWHARREQASRRADLAALRQVPREAASLTACLVGCGMIGQEHLKILSRMPGARVAAVCDANLASAKALADRFKVPRSYDNVEAMLNAEKPQVLHVLTPPQSHLRLAELAFQRGCNVLVEKPMAVDAAEARRMAELAARKGLALCVGHNKLYDPVVVRARRLVESGELGDLLWVESYCGFDMGNNLDSRYMLPGGETHWTFQIPGGLYQNLAPHPLCLALELLGKPTGISACARYGRVLPHASTDELRVLLETPSACGLVTVSLAASPRLEYLNIFGTRMIVSVDILNQWLVAQKVARGIPKPISRAAGNLSQGWTILRETLSGTLKVLRKRWTPYEGMEILIREFYASLRENRPAPVTAEEGVAVMEVMDRVWEIIGPEAAGVRPSK
jgi:predicted dehydrogenase/nucleoside-diphosphate-sugar epimerase